MAVSTIDSSGLTSPLSATNLGTPSALVLTNATGLPQAGLGTNVAGNGPAFSAYSNANQSVTNQSSTVLAANTKEFDTGGCYNNTGSTVTLNGLSVPAYAFCPNVAGYYQVNLSIQYSYSTMSRALTQFLKNGNNYKRTVDLNVSCNNLSGNTVIYLNGTGDYVQAASYMSATGTLLFTGGTLDQSWFNGAMVRSA